MMQRPDETERALTVSRRWRALSALPDGRPQRPSVVDHGRSKPNFPGGISFAVASGVDSA